MTKITMADLHGFNLECTTLPGEYGRRATYTVEWSDDEFRYHVWLYPSESGGIKRPIQIYKRPKVEPGDTRHIRRDSTTYLKDTFKKNSVVIDDILNRCSKNDLKAARDAKIEKERREEEKQRTQYIADLTEQAREAGFKLVPL